jgi:hypothetical protein
MRKKTVKPIDVQRMAIIAEQGIGGIRLSKEETRWLANEGFDELICSQTIDAAKKEQLPAELFNKALGTFFPPTMDAPESSLHVRLKNGLLGLINLPKTWNPGSIAFAWRSAKDRQHRLAFTHKEDLVTAHIEMVSRADEKTDISVRCNDPSGNPVPAIEIELLRSGRCIESVSADSSGPVTIRNVEKGPMQLCIHCAQGHRITLDMKID